MRFDPGKEHKLILDPHEPIGPTVKLLGILIDPDLRMISAINDCAQEASWRLRTLLRSRRFFSDRQILLHFKSHVLSYIEYRTPGIFHATTTALRPVDHILSSLLHNLDISADDCLLNFALAPLCTRRDIAMLGVIHRAVLRIGPPHFFPFFRLSNSRSSNRRHPLQLEDNRPARRLAIFDRSILGLIWVYNLLPPSAIFCNNIKDFQGVLQDIVKYFNSTQHHLWQHCLSNRISVVGHPLSLLSSSWIPSPA